MRGAATASLAVIPCKRTFIATCCVAVTIRLPPDAPAISVVTVQRGDTLWAISRDNYGSGFMYVRVFEANRDAIRDPDLIYPGQIFDLPDQ